MVLFDAKGRKVESLLGYVFVSAVDRYDTAPVLVARLG